MKTVELKAAINDREHNHFTRIVVKTTDDRSGFDIKVETAFDKGFALADRGICLEAKNLSADGMFMFTELCDKMVGPYGSTPITDEVRKLIA